MKGIEPLPERVRSSVRSGIVLYDLTRVVEELVFNSLDAGATKVSVAVGVATCFVKVSDNGSGIDREGLLLLGERYVTSKHDQLTDLSSRSGFGFRGESLCSISDVSVLEIVSKVHGMPHGYRKVMKGCKCLHLGISDDRHDAGTTVIVRDLFYNQPVRRKHMQSSPKKILHLAKECVLRIALVHSRVSFKVIDVESQDELLGTSSSSCCLSVLSTNFGIEATSSLYDLKASKGEFQLSGYVSGPLGILSLKALQYIYINSRFVCKGPIHKLLNQLAALYSDNKAHDTHGQTEKPNSRSSTCPAFILNVSCPRSHFDITYEPLKNSVEFKDWGPVLRFIQETVSQFWSENVSDDLPEYCEIRRKKSRIHQGHAPIQMPISHSEKLVEESNSLPPPRVSLSSCPMSSEDASDVKKPWDNPFFNEGTYCGVDLHDMSPCDGEEATNRMIHRADFASGNLYSNGDGYLLKELSMQDSLCKQVHCFPDSEWQNSPFGMKDQSTIPTRTQLCANFHEFSDAANAGQVFAKPSQPIHLKEMRMQDVGPLFKTQDGMEFSNVDFTKQTKWDDIGDRVDMDQMAISIMNTPCPSFHEYVDVSNANQVSAKPSQLSHLKNKHLQDIGLSFTGQGIMDLSKADFSMQTKWVDVSKEVDVGELDMDQIIEGGEQRHDAVKPLWLLSRCASQHDKTLKSKSLSRDMRPHFAAGEWSDEENYLVSQSSKRSKISDCMSLLSTSEWSTRMPNYLFDQIADADDFFGGDVDLEAGINAGYDISPDREVKYLRSDSDAAVNWLDAKYCSDISDCKYFVRLQEDISEVRGHKRDNSCFSNSLDLSSDEVNQVCANATDKSKLLDNSNPMCSRSVVTQLDNDKFGMIEIRNKEAQFQKRQAKRSNSAPPVYKGRRKFLDMHLLKIGGQQFDSVDLNSPEIGNIRKESRSFNESHFSSKENCVNDSVNDSLSIDSIPRLKKKRFQQKGLCTNSIFTNQVEDPMSKENQDDSKFDLKWQKYCQPSNGEGGTGDLYIMKGVMKSQNVGDHDTILDVSSGTLHIAGDSLVPTSISKTCLQDAKVLQQVDKKFIPVVGGSILAIIDQHAADERIRLEELRQKVLSGEMKQITYLEAEKELVLPEIGYQLLQSYVEQTQDWGWICDIHGPGSRPFAKKMNVLHKQQTVAKLVAVPCILGVNLTDTDLLEFLQQLADTDGSSTIPPSVLQILNNKACRGAIMFGDTLLHSECSLIVEELKKTSLCFQCAHGRPTTVPLVNLDVLHKYIDKLARRGRVLQELWHGLCRKEISLERAAFRLSSAMK